jgi:hypothetical protein
MEELQAAATSTAICYINGKRYELPPGRGEVTLLTYLRGTRLCLQQQLHAASGQQHFYRT